MSLRSIVAVSKRGEVQRLAREFSRKVLVADDLAEALGLVETVNPSLVLIDRAFSPCRIREFIDTTDNHSISVPVVVVGDEEGDADSSEDFINAGACGFLQGARDYSRLEQIVSRIKNESVSRDRHSVARTPSDERRATESGDFFADECAASVSMVGRSKAIINSIKMIKLIAASRCNPVLIVGETGTGKELAAVAVHELRHPNEPFVAVNCAALTANLLESELFGHVKGAFTGADRDKTGLFEVAGAGTIFLDEISEMPLDLQAKLLRVLQEKTFRKVGGIKSILCKATIIASSNQNLKSQIQANCFRRDLYYRLNVGPIILAPLRLHQRREDIPLLAEYFLKTSTICPQKEGKITSLTKLTVEALNKYDWPGNVRELRNVIERAILLETTDKIGLSSIIFDPAECGELSDGSTAGRFDGLSLAKAERELISRALQETGWQKTQAASLLGITRATLYAKVKQYKIEKGSYIAKEVQSEASSPHLPQAIAAPY